MAKNAIGLTIAAEEYGSAFFKNGAAPSGVLEHPGTLKDPSRVRESWNATFGGSSNSGKIAVLEEGMKYAPISIPPNRLNSWKRGNSRLTRSRGSSVFRLT